MNRDDGEDSMLEGVQTTNRATVHHLPVVIAGEQRND
jgi:hypothetical protein